ncbi:MAG TPA: cysteine--tRNA ligase [Nitrosopumilaceae archaeon]|nr:cysteine--tRNA ligase [Nitrosopumilaceae archaeon]
MKIHDTLSKNEKELDTSSKVRIYLCGVTVYDESHIGHARTIIIFEVLRRYLESKGIEVEFIQNFTDVDDKIINKAKLENLRASAISSRYIEKYYNDFDDLNIIRATKYPRATEHIQDMLDLIQDLLKKNIAYVSKNGVYFSVSKFPGYGKLSKKKIDELLVGARVEVDQDKKDPLDFALWKFSNDDPSWDSPWGRGRPGWHIECSAMSIKYLGENFEIHGGGRDLIFPHHENEIAQSESYTGKPFAKIWMHVGMITINGEKMSKSKGNIKSIRYGLENWGPNIIRLFCLSGHYSKPIDYSEELLQENITKWRQVESAFFEMKLAVGTGDTIQIKNNIKESQKKFEFALENDLDTHLAVQEFFKFVNQINQLAASDSLTNTIASDALPYFEKMANILGLVLPKISEEEISTINELIKKRELLRVEKKFADADMIRDQISKMGIVLIDHKNRTTWMKKEEIKSEKQ